MKHLKLGKISSLLRQRGFIGLGVRGAGPSFGGGGSSPQAMVAKLFANGEPGAVFMAQKPAEWGSNPDLVTMYQDAAGTTPVTALEQFVGLQLDVRPIFLGPELVTNGKFDVDATGWTAANGGTLSVASGQLTITNGAASTGEAFAAIPTRPGVTYQYSATRVSGTGGAAGRVSFQSSNIASYAGDLTWQTAITGTATGTFAATTNTSSITLITNTLTSGLTTTWDNVSVREVIAAPNAPGQPLRGAQLWNDANVAFAASSSRISPGVYRINSPTGAETADVQILNVCTPGSWYEVIFNVDSVTTASGGIRVGSASSGIVVPATVGPKRVIVQQSLPGDVNACFKRVSGITDVQISGISYRLLYGNHRSQATTGARAKISARYNKVATRNANPTDLTNITLGNATNGLATLAVVNDATALAAAGLSGVCTLGNVYKLDNSAGDTNAVLNCGNNVGNTNLHQLSAWVRGSGSATLRVNSTTGAAPTALTAAYQKRVVTITPAVNTAGFVVEIPAGSVAYIILMDMREACYSYLPTPQVVWDATTGYDDTGFPARLVYSGAQGYATGSVDFSGSAAAQAFTGLAKLSPDTAYGEVIGFSANPDANNGAFSHGISTSVGDASRRTYASFLTGTVSTGRGGYIYASPDIKVHTSLYDLSQATGDTQINMRLNGGAPSNLSGSTPSASPSAGQTLGAYPLFYGSRGGTGVTNPLTGDEFVSIVRGGPVAANDPRIPAAEQFCNQVMGKVF